MTIINCEYCGKPRPNHVKSCPYCKPTVEQKVKKAAETATKFTASVVNNYQDIQAKKDLAEQQKTIRHCLNCGFTGQMKTYLADSWGGIIIAFVLLCFWIVPGLIFIAVFWGKRKCPNCGSIGKNSSPFLSKQTDLEGTRICPHCAETIKAAAKLCRFCQKEVNPL